MTNFCPGANTRDTRCCTYTHTQAFNPSTYAISSWAWRSRRWLGYWQPIWRNFLRSVEVNIILHAYATKMGVYDVTKGYVLRQLDGVGWILKHHLSTKVTGCILSSRSILYCMHTQLKIGVYDITRGYLTKATGWSWKDIKTSFEYEDVRVYYIIKDWDDRKDIKFEKESVYHWVQVFLGWVQMWEETYVNQIWQQ